MNKLSYVLLLSGICLFTLLFGFFASVQKTETEYVNNICTSRAGSSSEATFITENAENCKNQNQQNTYSKPTENTAENHAVYKPAGKTPLSELITKISKLIIKIVLQNKSAFTKISDFYKSVFA